MKLSTLIIIALILGAIIGFYFPDDIFNDDNPQEFSADIVGQAIVTDGDTIKISGTRIRFHGIDAPELDQPCWIDGRQYMCGVEARSYLNHIINNQEVMCQTQSTDQYGRKVATCYNYKNEDIESLMVSAGMATAYSYSSYDYLIEEMSARFDNRGIWAGEFKEPYEFRQSKRN